MNSDGHTKKLQRNGEAVKPARAPSLRATDPNTLRVQRHPGKTEQRQYADMAVHGMAQNAMTMKAFASPGLGELSITDCCEALEELGAAANGGDLKNAEQMLVAQAAALNAIFNEMARRSGQNMGTHTSAAEMYMRLAFKAQSQCRTTIETLAEMKNPPVVFARQANITSGPQQVNNGVSTQAAKTVSPPNELLEDVSNERNGMDAGATRAAGRTDQELATVGAVNRAAKRSRKGRIVA